MNMVDWRKRLSSVVGPEVNKLAGSLIRVKSRNASTKYGKTAAARVVKRRRSYHAKNRSIKQDGEDELRRLRLLCQRQEEELKEKQALNEELQQENEDLRQDNELLNDRLRFAQDELEVLRFLHETTTGAASDDLDAIGPVDPTLTEETGKRIGELYELDGLLGKGSFGRVWLGRPPSSTAPHEQEVAIKEFDKSKIHSTSMLSRLKLECNILRRHGNSHPNIIGFVEVLHVRNSIYLVMEKADNSLVAFAGHQRAQPDFLQQVMLGVLRALAYLHERGISHGDIDPQNVLIRKPDDSSSYIGADCVRLCDFGLAHTTDHQAEERGDFVVGKPGYLAPELAKPKKCLDYRKADMWSLGCTLMAMTQGLSPRWFEYYGARRSDPSYFQASIAAYVEVMRNQGPRTLQFDLLVNGLLQIIPERRLSSDAALQHPWFQLSSQKLPQLEA